MRLTWLSNAPWGFTGYGNQTKVFTPRIKAAGHDLAIIAFWGHDGSPINWNGIQVYGKGYHPYGNDIGKAHTENFGAEAMISLLDAWVLDPVAFDGIRWIPWFPIDHDPLPERVKGPVSRAYERLVFSKFGCRMMDQAGLDYTYIPHGVETEVMKPLDMMESRDKLLLPKDKFIVGMVAANKGNPSRKAFTQNIAAFKKLYDKHDDAFLYLHTMDGFYGGEAAVNLKDYVLSLGLEPGKNVRFADQYGLMVGYTDQMMAGLYSSFDVHLLVSMGEGFGIPIVEAQACGCPVIVGDWTSMSELCFSGWKVAKNDAEPVWTPMQSYQYSPRVDAIYEKLEAAYQMRGNQDYRKRARDGAMAYDADRVYEKYWKPYLAKLEAQVASGKDKHLHAWGKIGLYNPDRTMSVPCLACDDELRQDPRTGAQEIIKDGFRPDLDLDLVPDTDGITKIVAREIKRDYQLDGLNLKPGDVVLDIGAHKGIVSCYLARKYPGIRVIAYEPIYENYDALLANASRNGLTIEALNKAITGDGRDISIGVDPDNSGGNGIYNSKGDRRVIASDTLAQIFENLGIERLSLLKIDCEGAEYEILADADLSRVDAIRGELHHNPGLGDPAALLKNVKAKVPNTIVSVQG